MEKKFLTIQEASEAASSYLRRNVTESNISYLIQYGKVRRYDEEGKLKRTSNGPTTIFWEELKLYYDRMMEKEKEWKESLGEDINWGLSFDDIQEYMRTKHVHRLHPYKGKFIPQLVEYFLDDHENKFKERVFFNEGDVVLDPFVGSGTTLVQCIELGMHSIGIDISEFNCMICRVKTRRYDLGTLSRKLLDALTATEIFSQKRFRADLEPIDDDILGRLNKKYYPSPEYKILIAHIRTYQDMIQRLASTALEASPRDKQKAIETAVEHLRDDYFVLKREIENFLCHNSVFLNFDINSDNATNAANDFARKYSESALQYLEKEKRATTMKQGKLVDTITLTETPFERSAFLSLWFTQRQRIEMQYYLKRIIMQKNPSVQELMKIILSRTVRSCRATTHADLATLIEPQSHPYYCGKHFRICKPVATIIRHLRRYTEDTIKRLAEFDNLHKNVYCEIIKDDSRTINLFDYVAKRNPELYAILQKNKIAGIFTSPPYVGQIDYHEQHAYAYELFKIDRKDELEIGRQAKGTGKKAQEEYIQDISRVLSNMKRFLKDDANVFIVANDKLNLYRKIAKESSLQIEREYKRPVLNRTERDKQPYSESIFHFKLR